CHANGGTIGFAAKSAEMVKAFHDAGVAAGGKAIEDPPGERNGPFGTLNLAYLRDPSGNKVCALHRVA
ncbi:MAG TPA: VOC family protein, partial [Brevundimonas sp.]|nr:VOC family protein [Brevundimonas sp.]